MGRTTRALCSWNTLELFSRSIVFFQQLAHAIVRESFDPVIVAARHVVIIDQSVDDRFFGCLHRGGEDRVHSIVRHGRNRMGDWVGVSRARVRRRKGDEQITRAVARDRTGAGESERNPTRKSFELIWQKRRIGGNNGDARATLFLVNFAWNFFANRNAGYRELCAAAEISL
jgi:hypothetical protein